MTFLTDEVGKLTGIAKGAKNSRRRFANCLDPFTRVRVHFRTRPGATLVFMDSCDLLQQPGRLTDPAKFAYGSYLVELVDQLTAEAQPIRELYELLAEGLDALQHGAATPAFLRTFELRLLHRAGYGPQLRSCGRCEREVASQQRLSLDLMHGAIVCSSCQVRGEATLSVADSTLAFLEASKNDSLEAAQSRRLSAVNATEAAQVMGHLLALHLARPLRSTKLIAALTALG